MGWRDLTHALLGITTRTFNGPAVVWRPDTGGRAIFAVYDGAPVLIDPQSGARIVSTTPTLGVRVVDLGDKPAAGHLVDVDGVRYRVEAVEFDGQGGATLTIKRTKP